MNFNASVSSSVRPTEAVNMKISEYEGECEYEFDCESK